MAAQQEETREQVENSVAFFVINRHFPQKRTKHFPSPVVSEGKLGEKPGVCVSTVPLT